MLTYRLNAWRLRKNCTKNAVEEYFQSGAHQSTLSVRGSRDKAKLIDGAERHGIKATFTAAPGSIDRYILPPDAEHRMESILTSVSHYVAGVSGANEQTAESAPIGIVTGFLDWAYGSTPNAFRLLNFLTLAKLCHKAGQTGWAGILMRPAFSELETCLRGDPYLTIPVILSMFGGFGELPPEIRPLLLRHCLELSKTFARGHPIRRIFEKMRRMDPKSDHGSLEFTFRQAAVRFTDDLDVHLGVGGHFACSLVRPLNEGTAASLSENPLSRSWIDPEVRRMEDPLYFDVNMNVERCIVQTVEFRGHAELLRVRAVLEQQREATQSDSAHEELTYHLRALEVPIHRIGYRDCLVAGDRDGFVAHWRQLTDDRNPAEQHALDSEHLKDMMVAWKFFTLWGRLEEAQIVQRRIEKMLETIHETMI